MSNKKERKAELDEFLDPHILTLDQALALYDESLTDAKIRRRTSTKAVSAIRNRVCCRFSGPGDFDALNYGEKMVWDITYMEGEVLNGGFHQYLTNSTGESGEAVKGYLRDIGAEETLNHFDKLSAIFPGGKIPKDRQTRSAYVDEWGDLENGEDIFDELDRCFYRQIEDINALILAYIRTHRVDFTEPPEEVIAKFKRLRAINGYYKKKSQSE